MYCNFKMSWKQLTSNKFVSEGLCLGDSAKTASGNLFGVQVYRLFRDVEPLLYNRSQLTDSAALLSQHTLGPRRHDNDFGLGGGDSHLHAGVAILGQFPGEELIEFRLENSVTNEL